MYLPLFIQDLLGNLFLIYVVVKFAFAGGSTSYSMVIPRKAGLLSKQGNYSY